MNANVPSFKQWNNFSKLSFQLFPDYVAFDIGTSGRHKGFNARYEELPGPFYYKTFRPRYFAVILILFICGAQTLAQLFILHPQADTVERLHLIIFCGVFTASLCAAALAARSLIRKSYTVLTTRAGNILIAKRGAHDQIIEQLQNRRMAALKKFAVIDPVEPPWKEVKKFKWLRDEGVISDEEYRAYSQSVLDPIRQGTAETTKTVVH